MTKPLKNLKIIELASVLAGPSVGLFFAEQGSKVIKIENTQGGDVTRSWKLPGEDPDTNISAYFASVNYGKEYVQLNLKEERDRQKLLILLKEADVLLTNFKKGDAERYQLDYESLKNQFPKLILGEINGFGEESDRVAYDLILQAESGFMSINGQPASSPTKMPVALIDILAGHQLKEGILVALMNRATSGTGAKVTVSLFETAVASLANQASNYLMTGTVPKRMGSLHPNIAPYGEIFITKDKKEITFAIGSSKQFVKLCGILHLKDLPDNPIFANNQLRVNNREKLAKTIKAAVSTRISTDILRSCTAEKVPAAIVRNISEVLNNKKTKDLILTEAIDGIITKRVRGSIFKIEI